MLPSMHWTADLYAYARKHRGAFALRWAPLVGTTPKTVLAKALRESWARPYRGVVMIPGAVWDHMTDLTAAQAAVPALAAARGQSAAWLYGLVPRPPARPQLLLPHAHQTRLPVGLTRRSRHLSVDDTTAVSGVVTLTPTFWLISTAGDTDHARLLSFAIDARQRRLLDIDETAARLESMPQVAGRARLLRVLQRLSHDGSDSMFESDVRARLFEAGLLPSSAPVPVTVSDGRTIHVDIAFPAAKVAVECLGFIAHSTRAQLNSDALRENALALVDEWLVLRLTVDRYRHDWDGFVAELKAALAKRTARR